MVVLAFALTLPVALKAATQATAETAATVEISSQAVGATPTAASMPASAASSASPAASSVECVAATVTALAEADAWIAEGTTSNKGSDGALEVEANPSSGNARALVRFRLPSGGVPQGCVVASARLRLYTSSGSEGSRVEALRLASAWAENQVVWSNQPGTVGTAASAWSTDGYMHWNVTSQVQAVFESSNHGFQIRDAAEGTVEGGSGHGFNSREKGEDPPQLVIRFAAPSAGEPLGPAEAPAPGALSCGQVLTRSIVATNDLSECSGDGLVIGAPNIVVDLDGHRIDGVGLGAGILNDGFARVTVMNGAVEDFDYGIKLLSETELNVVERLTVRDNELTGIELFDARSGNEVRDNTVESNGGGIALGSGTTGTVVADNTIRLNSGAGLLVVDSNDNLLERNSVSGSSDLGIGLERSSANTLLENVISENSDGGIEIRYASHGNRVEGNDVSDSGDTGIMVAESDRNELISNTTRRMSDSGITLNTANDGVVRGNDVRFSPGGVQMDGSSRNEIESNDASETSGIGIELGGGSYDNDLVLNRADGNAATGIYVSDEALTEPGNLLDRNTADGNGSDGITVAKGGHTIVGNVVRNNKAWGINATGANVDGLFNVATGNGQAQQCSGIVCKADWLPPETDISSGPAGLTNSTSASFVFGGEDDTTAAASLQFECRLDLSGFATCSSPKTYTGLTPGQHTFEARARDASGSVDPSPATWSWTIDTTPPDTTIESGPSGPTNDSTPTFVLSSEAGASFECALAAGTFAPCASPYTTGTLAEGAYILQVRAIDTAGNNDATPASRGFSVDTTEPETTIDSGPSGLTTATSASIAFSANEAATFECSLDDAAFAACVSPLALSGLGDGTHRVQVRATDAAGNVDGTPSSREWAVDTTPPETTIDSGPSGPTNDSTPTFAFSSEAGASFECALDTGSFIACTSPHTTTALAEGVHTFRVRAVDAAGNADATPASTAFTLDTIAPETTIDSGPTGLTKSASASFGFSAAEAATFECRLDEGAYAPCTSPRLYSALADGEHRFQVRAIDAAGNTDASPAGRAFAVDTIAPETTIESGPAGLTTDSTPTFELSANETGGSFACKLDAAAFAPCTTPFVSAALTDGAHSFEVKATDAAGNEDATPASRSFTIDTTAPETTIDSGPTGLTNDSNPTFAFSSEAGASFECALDAGAFVSCTSPHSTAGLTDGAHTFRVRAVDEAGNTDVSPAGRAITVDTAAPETSIDSGPSGVTTNTDATFTFSSGEAGSSFACSLDGDTFAPCTSPQLYGTLADGGHSFQVRATDAAGNADGSPASRTWTVDTTAPETSIDTAPSGPTSDSTPTFAFSSEPGATFQCGVDAAAFVSCTSPHTTELLSEGAHTFEVRASDAAGNTDATPASRAFTVDTIAPETTIVAGPSGVTDDSTPTFAFSSEAGANLQCSLDASGFAPCISPQTTAVLADGAHTFEVRASDAAGNVDATPANRPFTVDTTAPQTTIDSGPPSPTTSTTATFFFSSSESGSAFACSLDSGALVACMSPRQYTGLAVGTHQLQVRATDAAGNADATPASFAWTIQVGDTTAPHTTIDSGPSGPTNDPTPTFTFSSEPGATFQCRVDTASFVSCTSPHATATLAQAVHTFEVRATDTAGNTDATPASRAFTVDTTAPQTTIDSGPPSSTTSTAGGFEFSSSESGSTFGCSLDGGVFTACTSPRQYVGLTVGTHQFQVQATDAGGNTDQSAASFAWTIQATDTTPPQTTIDSGPAGPTNDSTPTFTFSSEPGATFECRVDTAAFVSCTSPHTTAALAQAAHTFEARARDAAGNVDTSPASRAFTVDTIAPVTTIASGPLDPTTQRSASFTFSANETALRFECALDTTAFTTCSSGISYAGPLALGDHDFRVRTVDPVGNVGAADSHTWTIEAPPAPVDTTPPVITLTGPLSGTQSTSAAFTFSANESSSFRCRLDTATFDNCSSSTGTSYIGLQPGEHVFRVEATDLAGNVSTASHTWTIVAPGGCTGGGTVTAASIADSWVLQSSATSNYGNDSVIKVDTKAGANARALVRFTLPALPSGCRVVTATLRLYAGSYKQGRTLEAVALGTTWSQGTVTWNNQPAATGPAATVASRGGYVEWSVAQQVAGMYSSANNGFLIRDATENGQGVEQGFNSREKGTDNPPQLVVTFGP